MVLCTNCKHDVTAEDDYQAGYSCCPLCGAVLVEGTYENAVAFGEEGSMIGQILSDERKPHPGGTSERGFHEISLLVDQLRIHPRDDTIDAALRLYKMAVVRGFLKGRRSNQVAACCIYIMCRTDKRPYLLIDFSDALRINVYVLGCVFLDLCCLFKLDEHPIILNPIDPSLFIHRYVDRLNFGSKASAVTQTALKLIKSMNRDWIQTGRKPSGICAASLFIASQMHNVPKTKRDIIYVARIGVSTVAQRLTEFSKTHPGTLTAEEFHKEALKMEKLEQIMLSQPKRDIHRLGCHHLENGTEIFAIGMCRNCYHQFLAISGGIFEGTADPPSFSKRQQKGTMNMGKALRLLNEHESNEERRRIREQESREAPALEEVEAEMDIALSSRPLHPLGPWTSFVESATQEDALSEEPSPRGNILENKISLLTNSFSKSFDPEDEELPFDDDSDDMAIHPSPKKERIEVDDLDNISDIEILQYILPPEETKQKRTWWRELHAEHLKKVAERKERPIEQEKKRRRVVKRSRSQIQEYPSAFEAVKGMLEDKGLSSKINYDNLEALFAEGVEDDVSFQKTKPPSPILKKESFFMRSLSFKRKTLNPNPRKRLDGLFD